MTAFCLCFCLSGPSTTERPDFSEKTKTALVKLIDQQAKDWRATKNVSGRWSWSEADTGLIWVFDASSRSLTVEGLHLGRTASFGTGWYQFEGGELVYYPWKDRKVADRSSARIYEIRSLTDTDLVVVNKATGMRYRFKKTKP